MEARHIPRIAYISCVLTELSAGNRSSIWGSSDFFCPHRKFTWRLVLIVLAVYFASVGPLLPSSEDPAIAKLRLEVQGKGWVAFGARSRAGDWDLFLCRPDGSQLRPLTSTPDYNEFSPQFSRDGRKLLYRRMPRQEVLDNNRHGEQGELVLANSDGSSPVVLGKPGEIPWASFNPDGTQLASLSIKGVAFIDLSTRQVLRKLSRKGFFQQMTWSPDGNYLIGVANSFGTGWSIARMEVASGEVIAVNRVDCCTPDWFPDSRDVIFSWRPPGQKANQGYGWTQLWRCSVDGASRQLLYAEDGRHVYGGNISPDGNYFLFTGNMSEDGDPKNSGSPMAVARLQDAPMIGGESRELRLAHPGAHDGPVLTLPVGWEPCWTFAEIGQSAGAGAALNAGPDKPRETVAALAADLHNRGSLVVSAKNPSGDWDLFAMRPDGSERRRLTDTREFSEAGARFSPDGTRLLYYRVPRAEAVDNNTYGTFELVVAKSDGTDPESLGNGFPWSSWGPDSQQIACLAPTGIQIVDLASKKILRQFPRKGLVEQLVWSPDGKWFIGTANGLGQFWNIGLLNPETGQVRAVSETDRYNCTPDWWPDSKCIVYARGIIPEQGGRAELWTASLDGKERHRIYSEPRHHIYGACASPDGKFIMFTRSVEDLGQVGDIQVAIIRSPEKSSVSAENVPRLDLGFGWEPHWTAHDIFK